ncbi:TetR/AcrR family transcriptional regulator [Actibacterium pelagium]|uniref:TetR family transcriptional regulator n=1 Tax=Actibacterium pelagium TaxID=2029103 RepID=A0A917AGY5_9RHOB|nr:TetR/AcrR family transcriptional regulator [Actibacterium pelagium]GGE52080.1 TetR family transcriptional regulator [Actibacterium pelagium]
MTKEINRGRKFEQVLKGAREVFVRDGFEGASVDDIARAAGVSKATLYNYFPDKRLLFAEVARTEAARLTELALDQLDPTDAPEETLYLAGKLLQSFITSELGQAQLILCAAESRRFPELGQMFYEAGPKQVRDHLGTYLREADAAGLLNVDDADLAADQFHELCKASIFPKMFTGVQTQFEPAELERVLTGAVQTFLARYGASKD